MIVYFKEFNESLLSKELREKDLIYHATSFENLISILNNNVLFGTDTYDWGVSTSRNKNYLFARTEDDEILSGGAEVQLILDRVKIKQHYKIVPFDWEEYKKRRDQKYHQSEEKILTSVLKPIDKYIVGIHLNKNISKNLLDFYNITDKIIKNNWILFDSNWKPIEII